LGDGLLLFYPHYRNARDCFNKVELLLLKPQLFKTAAFLQIHTNSAMGGRKLAIEELRDNGGSCWCQAESSTWAVFLSASLVALQGNFR
jgi:hypothetical protein